MPNTHSVSLIELGDLPSDAFTGAPFSFALPGATSNLVARGQFIQKSANGDYVWWANLLDGRGYLGVSSNQFGKVAYLQVDTQCFVMHLLSSRYNALVKLNTHYNTLPQLCAPDLNSPENTTFNEDCEEDNDCPAVISVLVLETPEALAWLGANISIQESALYVLLGLNTVNFALINSGVYHKSFRFVLEGFNFTFDPINNAEKDLDNMSIDPNMISRRNINRADLVFMLSDTRYPGLLGVTRANQHIGIVSMEHIGLPHFVMAHELGHAIFLNHNRESNGGNVPYEDDEFCGFGWRFPVTGGGTRKSIMAILNMDDNTAPTTVLHFSNPNIEFNGTPTGTPINFNARIATHNMCGVDDVYSDTELEVNINGPVFICEEQATWTANISSPGAGVPGVGPYTYLWRVNDSPYFSFSSPGVFLGTGNAITFYSGTLPLPEFWLYLSVTSADGVIVNDVFKVDNPCDGSPLPLASSTTGSRPEMRASAPQFNIFPNPSRGKVMVSCTGVPVSCTYNLYNAVGSNLVSGKWEDTSRNLDIETANLQLPNGVYYLSLQGTDTVHTLKFNINH